MAEAPPVVVEADQRGERNGNAVLAEHEVRQIKRELSRGHTAAAVARAFHVSRSTICLIRDGKTWRHVR